MEDQPVRDRGNLTKTMRWKIADWLAEDRLPEINQNVKPVHVRKTFYSKYVKRLLDIVISFIAVIVTLPFNLIIGIITLLDVGWPVFFSQVRAGRDGKPLTIIKFRSMKNTTDERGELLPASERVTGWGKFIRKTSLDELLNFWPVLFGQMSLIGPRPLPLEYLGRFNDRHKMRLAVRPGLECPPHERIDHVWTWEERFENDIWYVEHISFKTDCLMIIRLIQYAFDSKNAASRSGAEHGIFMGYDLDGSVIRLQEVPQEYIDRALKGTKENGPVEGT